MDRIDKHSVFLEGAYQEAAMLLVNKPLEWTSFDVVNKIRYTLKHHFKVKKIKVGHAGTLDPLADGLLILCSGKGTKQIDNFQGMPKTYTGTVKLGATTKTYDAEAEEEELKSIESITESLILEAAKSFEGEQEQTPPMYSALKVDGQQLYKWARLGIKKNIKSRKVVFYSVEIEKIELPFVYFRIECSKGTYIRSFAHDLGQKLGCGGYLTKLTRTAIGEYKLEDAFDLKEWVAEFGGETREGREDKVYRREEE